MSLYQILFTFQWRMLLWGEIVEFVCNRFDATALLTDDHFRNWNKYRRSIIQLLSEEKSRLSFNLIEWSIHIVLLCDPEHHRLLFSKYSPNVYIKKLIYILLLCILYFICHSTTYYSYICVIIHYLVSIEVCVLIDNFRYRAAT